MFTYHLSLDEKQALLKLVGYLATTDEDISPEERKFVLDLAHDMKVSAQGVFDGVDAHTIEDLCAPFERASARRVVLVELVDLGLSDHSYFAEEKAAVREVAEIMGVAESEVDAIEDWVRRGQQWHREGQALLGLVGDQKMGV